mgnify:FL=1
MSQNVVFFPASGNGGTSRADSRKAELLAALEAQQDGLTELYSEWCAFTAETRQKASELEGRYRRLTGGLYPALLDAVSSRRNIPRNHLLGALHDPSYDSRSLLDEGLSRMKTALLMAGQSSRLLEDFIQRQEEAEEGGLK